MNAVIEHPPYYARCTDTTRHIVAMLIGSQYLDRECIDVADELCLQASAFSAIKYLWRAGEKDDLLTDLKKAEFYLKRCIDLPRLCGLGNTRKALEKLQELIEEQVK